EDDGEQAGRRVDGRLQQHRLAGGLASNVLGRVRLEVLEAEPPTAALDRVLAVLALLGQALDVQSDHRLHVLDQRAVAGRDRDMLDLIAERDYDASDHRIVGARRRVRAANDVDFLGRERVPGWAFHGVEVWPRARTDRHRADVVAAAG